MTQLTSQFLRFVKTLVRSEFGENVAKIADALIVFGAQNQQQLTKNAGLEKDEIKRGLIVLLAHGIAFVQTKSDEGKSVKSNSKKRTAGDSVAPRVEFIYEFDIEKARLRGSAVWHVHILKQRFGKEGELIAETFIQHGKLLKNQLFSLVVTRGFASESEEHPSEGAVESARRKVQSVFKSMSEQRYLQPAPTVSSGAREPASKRANRGEGEDEGGRAGEEPSEENTYYMLNFEQLKGDFVRLDVVDHVQARLNPAAASIVDLIMKQPAPLTKQQILERATEFSAPKLTPESLQEYLDELISLKLVAHAATTYMVDTQHIMSQLRAQHALSIVSGTFEALGGRIFRLLLQHRRLEEKQVVELSTAPKQKVRSLLYAMLKRGFVSLQEVPKTPDRHPNRTFYLWGVPSEQVSRCLLESFCGTWANIRIRLSAETAKIKPIHDKMDLTGSESLNEAEVEQFNKWKRGDDRMHHSLLQLDRLISLFRD